MKRSEPVDAIDPLLVEASAWRVRLTEMGADTSPEFEAWLAGPGHAEAWSKVSGLWDYLGGQANETEFLIARHTALGDTNRAHARLNRSPQWRNVGMGLAAAACFFGAVWTGVWWMNRPDDYATAVGERRIVTLSDGSRISLDSDSEVAVHYSRAARELNLLKGQARFDVAHNVERPFSVLARDQKVIATGTAFNIDITGAKVTVTLIEGHVAVVDEDAPKRMPITLQPIAALHPSFDLKAGQQLVALPRKVPEIRPANLSHVIAWTSGQLMFDDEPLTEVVTSMNRYTSTAITIADPRAGRLRISGDFSSSDAAGFVDSITRYLPVKAVPNGAGGIALKSKD